MHKGVGRGPTLAWPGWKQPDISVKVDTARLATSRRVGNFRQKNNSAEDGIYGTNAVPRNKNPRNSVPNPSAEEKTTRNSVTLNKNRSELSEFPSEHFSGRESNSDFLSVDTKIEEYSQNSLPNPSAEEKTTRNSVPWKKYRSKLSEFRSEPFRGREPAQHKTRQPKISIIVSEKTTFEVRRNHFAVP